MVRVRVSNTEEFSVAEKGGYSDSQFVSHFKGVVVAVTTLGLNIRMSSVAYLASYLCRAKFLPAALVTTIIHSLVDWCYAYCKLRDFDMNPRAHQVFYSGCQVSLITFDLLLGGL
ncbi:hypothetical protein LR48_Vigan01g167500 [Vigna angularis]|uniref:Uncharacterized protein n=1 Tax=Phaseolus angularis TaxID=3914 RepID=A0A0L9TPN1_PHAAN|nr:hypothetical protein LR48_Vigan01g167500 [Vigna angularis]